MLDNENYGLSLRQGNSFSLALKYRVRADADSPYVSGLAAGDELNLRIIHKGGTFNKALTYDETTGQINFNLTYTETRGLTAGAASYELELKRAPSVQETLLAGPIKIKAGNNAD